MKASKAQINLGEWIFDGYLIDGLKDADGEPVFGLSMTQAGVILGLTQDPRQAAKRVIQKFESKGAQTRFPQGLLTHQNLTISDGSAKGSKVNIIDLNSFSKLIRLCTTPQAETLADALTGYSLRKVFCAAFGIEFSDDAAMKWMISRMAGVEQRNEWTDAIADYLDRHCVPKDQRYVTYAAVSDILNLALTGHNAAYWRKKFNCTTDALRSRWNRKHLGNIKSLEDLSTRILRKGRATPTQAMEQAIDFGGYSINPHPEAGPDHKPFDRVRYQREYMRERRANAAAKAGVVGSKLRATI